MVITRIEIGFFLTGLLAENLPFSPLVWRDDWMMIFRPALSNPKTNQIPIATAKPLGLGWFRTSSCTDADMRQEARAVVHQNGFRLKDHDFTFIQLTESALK